MPTHHPFRYVNSWQCLTQAEAAAVKAFWIRENAHVDGIEADRRVHQVVIRTFAANGELAAISTVETRIIPRLLQPMYYYRCFTGAAWRHSKVLRLRELLQKSFEVLEDWAGERDFPCIGMLLELEHDGFERTLQRAYWSNGAHPGYAFIGRSVRGLDLRVRYFLGARLKTQAEVTTMLHAASAMPVTSQAPVDPAIRPALPRKAARNKTKPPVKPTRDSANSTQRQDS